MIKRNLRRTKCTLLTKLKICHSLIIIDYKSIPPKLLVVIKVRKVNSFKILRKTTNSSIKIGKITATVEVTKEIIRITETQIIEVFKIRPEWISLWFQIVKKFKATLKTYKTWIKPNLMESYANCYPKLWVLNFKIQLSLCNRLLNLVSKILDKGTNRTDKTTVNAAISNINNPIDKFI